jgi:hypothetical protein
MGWVEKRSVYLGSCDVLAERMSASEMKDEERNVMSPGQSCHSDVAFELDYSLAHLQLPSAHFFH